MFGGWSRHDNRKQECQTLWTRWEWKWLSYRGFSRSSIRPRKCGFESPVCTASQNHNEGQSFKTQILSVGSGQKLDIAWIRGQKLDAEAKNRGIRKKLSLISYRSDTGYIRIAKYQNDRNFIFSVHDTCVVWVYWGI